MKISLNSILIMLVSSILVFVLFADAKGTYLHGSELQVFLLLVVTLFSLIVNAYFKNEFLEMLNVVFVVFYIFRIPVLFDAGVVSDVTKKNVDIAVIPWEIFILSFQYLSLVVCILAVNPKIPRWNINANFSEFIFKRLLLFSLVIIIANIIMISFWFNLRVQTLSHIPAILKTIFTIESALMLIIVLAFSVEKKILLKYKYFISFCFILGIGCITYQGGKAIVLSIVLLIFFAMLIVKGPVVFRLRGLLVTAGLALSTFGMYAVGATFRMYQAGGGPMNNIGQYGEFFHRLFIEKTNLPDLLHSISYRLGYFDFFIEKVSNPVYEPFVSFTYYFKALLDKVTPGFDFFGVPFMSRALYTAYHGDTLVTNSEFITVFGESHLLLGFFSFCLFLPILMLIKYTLSHYRNTSGLSNALFYMYILYMFYWWLTGMGLDMLIAFLIYIGIFIFTTMGLIRYWSWREHAILND